MPYDYTNQALKGQQTQKELYTQTQNNPLFYSLPYYSSTSFFPEKVI